MNANIGISITAVALLAVFVMPVQLAAQQHHHYKLIDMGTFGGPTSVTQDELQVLNRRGMVTGGADTSMPNHPNSCLFCGAPFITHAFQWQNEVLTDLGAFPGLNSSGASWISDSGLSAGFSESLAIDPLLGIREMHAALWKNGEIIDLGTLEGGHESLAFAINSRGQVAGISQTTVPSPFDPLGTQQRTFLWQKGVMEDLGTLGGPEAGLLGFKGNVEMNENGQIVACSFTNSTLEPCDRHPYRRSFPLRKKVSA